MQALLLSSADIPMSSDTRGKPERHLQSASAKNKSNANFTLNRHLQPSDKKDRDAKHGNVAQKVEDSGGEI